MAITAARARANSAPERRPQGNIPAQAFVMICLLALGMVMVAEYPITNRSGLVQFEQYLVIIYSAIRAAMCLRRRQPRIVTLITWLFVYTLFGLVQTVQLSFEDNPFHVPLPDSVMSRQLFAILIGCLAFDIVASLQKPSDRPRRHRQLSLRRVTVISWITVLATPLMIGRLGGLHALFGSRIEVGNALGTLGFTGLVPISQVPTSQILLLAFSNVSPFLCLFALARLRQADAFRFIPRPDLALLLVLLIGENLVFNNPISQPRFWIATIGIGVVFAGRWLWRIGFQVAFVGLFIVTTLFIFPYLDLFRYQTFGQATVQSQNVTQTFLNKTDYGSAPDIANTIIYVDDHGHTDGRQLEGAALFFVPRSIWHGKPTDTAPLLAVNIGYVNNLNIDSPLWAEGYIDFGYFGTVLVMGLFGFVAGRMDRNYIAGVNPQALLSILVPAFAGYELILLRGSLLQAVGRLAMMLLIGYFLSRRGDKPAEPGPALST